MSALDTQGVIFVPEGCSQTKTDAIKRAGGEVRYFGTDGLDTEIHAREYAAEHGMQYLSPYNDEAVICGQGSCGVEIAKQLASVDAIFIAVGGGGLISGVGSFLKSVNPAMAVIACQPEASAVMTKSVQAGEILDLPSEPTLSDGTAGGIEAEAITFEICRSLADDYVLVTEAQIAEAIREFLDAHHQLAEGAAGVALAGLKCRAAHYQDKNVVVIICGGNISRETLKQVI